MAPNTLIEAVRYFSNLDVCNAYMRRIKWPNGTVTCPDCDAKGKRIGEIASRSMFRCKDCRKQFSHKVGTIFEDSALPLTKWFVAVWCVANAKNGISSHELARAIGVTQKTAWFMLHRIRKAMEVGCIDKFDGQSEADTTYVGGRAANMHKHKRAKRITGRGGADKTAVHGVLRRAAGDAPSQVYATVVTNEDSTELLREVRQRVRYGAKVFTDSAPIYSELCLTHIHKAIDHSVAYVRGEIHTNGIENFWSLFKRSIRGTWIAVAPHHLQRYVTEQVWRFNNRTTTDGARFAEVMSRVTNKRLTWRLLCNVNDAGFMGLS